MLLCFLYQPQIICNWTRWNWRLAGKLAQLHIATSFPPPTIFICMYLVGDFIEIFTHWYIRVKVLLEYNVCHWSHGHWSRGHWSHWPQLRSTQLRIGASFPPSRFHLHTWPNIFCNISIIWIIYIGHFGCC